MCGLLHIADARLIQEMKPIIHFANARTVPTNETDRIGEKRSAVKCGSFCSALGAEAKVATSKLVVNTELAGTVTSNTSASGAPLSSPSGMAEAFLTRCTIGPMGLPFSVTDTGATFEAQLGGRRSRATHERCIGAFE